MSTNLLTIRGHSDFAVTILPEAETQKKDALALAGAVVAVTTAAEQQDAIAAASLMKTLVRGMEATRVEVKKPVLNASRIIDETAKSYNAALSVEIRRVEGLAADYQREQNRIAEAARREEEARQTREREAVEAERQREIAADNERRRIADEARLADLAKIQAAKDEEAREAARLEADRAAEARAEAANREQAAWLQREKERQDAERDRARDMQALAAPKAAGASVRVQMDYEVTDIDALYKAHPRLVKLEPRRAEIIAVINVPDIAPIPGLRVFETTKLAAKVSR